MLYCDEVAVGEKSIYSAPQAGSRVRVKAFYGFALSCQALSIYMPATPRSGHRKAGMGSSAELSSDPHRPGASPQIRKKA